VRNTLSQFVRSATSRDYRDRAPWRPGLSEKHTEL